MRNDHSSWGTDKELKFLAGLGTWSTLKRPRIELLKKYRKSMKLRDDWGPIDKGLVEDYLRAIM